MKRIRYPGAWVSLGLSLFAWVCGVRCWFIFTGRHFILTPVLGASLLIIMAAAALPFRSNLWSWCCDRLRFPEGHPLRSPSWGVAVPLVFWIFLAGTFLTLRFKFETPPPVFGDGKPLWFFQGYHRHPEVERQLGKLDTPYCGGGGASDSFLGHREIWHISGDKGEGILVIDRRWQGWPGPWKITHVELDVGGRCTDLTAFHGSGDR